MLLEILVAGFCITIQDGGRHGWRRFGVPLSGATDGFALAAVNSLVGNPADTANLEAAMSGGTFCTDADLLVAAAGPGWMLEVGGRKLPGWMAVVVKEGQPFSLISSGMGRWGYMAISGGLNVPLVMDSRSTCLRAGFGGWQGRALQAGDRLPLGAPLTPQNTALAGSQLGTGSLPDYAAEITARVVPGPHTALFTDEGHRTFFSEEYTVSENSDRMGYRLEGKQIEHRGSVDVLSQGVLPGTVQVAADGMPMVLMSDAQTTGGYAQIGEVIRADLPRLAQLMPGGKVKFKEVTAAEARGLQAEQLARLARGLRESAEEADTGA